MVEVEALREQAAQLEDEAAALAELVQARRREAAVLRARAERLERPEHAITPAAKITALARVRGDGLLAAAGVAVERLPAGFTAKDVAGALGIRDEARAMRLLLAVAELGHAAKLASGGWACVSEDEAHVRDYVMEAGIFTLADVVALGFTESEAAEHVERLRARGVIEGEAGHYTYVDVEGDSPPREDRRPPEKEPPAYMDAPRRGEAVRVVNHGKRGSAMSGSARAKAKRRDQARERAVETRAAKEAARQAARAASKAKRGQRRR
jgi:hypothetical protein